MKCKIWNVMTLSLTVIFFACGNGAENGKQADADKKEEKSDKTVMEKGGLKVKPYDKSEKYPDASLELVTPENHAAIEAGDGDKAQVNFEYTIENYALGKQTPKADKLNLANSPDGQHIHLILNDDPYMAHYEPKFELELEAGHYIALSFLSRSYHESLKHANASHLIQFNVGNSEKEVDLSKPLLFYSRPKGSYEGNDTKKVLLDFYVLNAKLGKDGYKVRATINGDAFVLDKWIPYVVKGLPMGMNTFKLELLDKDGKPVDSPMSSTERKIFLEEADKEAEL